jgi:hypothetical protein
VASQPSVKTARRPAGTATWWRACSQVCTSARAKRLNSSPAGVSDAPALLRTKRLRPSSDSSDRTRALTAVCVTFRRSAARMKLPLEAISRKVRASSMSIATPSI